MGNNQNKKYLGTVNLSDEELEDMSLDISYSEGTRLITFILGEEKYGLDILRYVNLSAFRKVSPVFRGCRISLWECSIFVVS